MAHGTKPGAGGSTGGYRDRFWIPRFWDGMNLPGWWRLLVQNRFAVAPKCWAMALIISDLATVNSALGVLQNLIYGRRIRRARIEEHPLFIIGHWRAGTTLLHELMVLDRRHTYPDTYACFAPNHFVLTGRVFPKMLHFLMPSQRPMDNMQAGWARPQEDEFALCNMGLPSPYLTIAFPNRPAQCREYLDLEGVAPDELRAWQRQFEWFLKCLTACHPGRIVLKSPPHTARIKPILDLWPDARFVHIVRDPYVLFPSTVNLWKRLYQDEGLQIPTCAGLEEHVFETLTRMYGAFERQRELVRPSRLCDVRYEELVRDPIGQMERIYGELELGGFDQARPAIEAHMAAQADYKTNRYELTPELRDEITRRWGAYAERYGYTPPLAASQAAR
ncbi:MAG: sulfotransferase [Pirellulales bacterium]|nr:sulfotransferase [Pirellulales bacterium]